MEKIIAFLGVILFAVIAIVITSAIYGLFVMLLWNLVIPSIFVGAPLIGFWQGFGLAVLGHLLSGGSSSSSSSKN